MDASPLFFATSDLTKSQKHEFLFDFSIFDALDACLMVHGSWLKAHGSWPREARGGSWPGAGPAPGTQEQAGPDPDPGRPKGRLFGGL